jgi:hypothetical protein
VARLISSHTLIAKRGISCVPIIDRQWSDFEHLIGAALHTFTASKDEQKMEIQQVFAGGGQSISGEFSSMLMMRDTIEGTRNQVCQDDTIWCRRKVWAFDQTWRDVYVIESDWYIKKSA